MRKLAIATAVAAAIGATAAPAVAAPARHVTPQVGCWLGKGGTPRACNGAGLLAPPGEPYVSVDTNYIPRNYASTRTFIDIVNENLPCFGQQQVFAGDINGHIAIHKDGSFAWTGHTAIATPADPFGTVVPIKITGRFLTRTSGTMTFTAAYGTCGTQKQAIHLAVNSENPTKVGK